MQEFKSWSDVPDNLKSKTYCAKERLILKNVNPVARKYDFKYKRWIDLYDITTLDLKKPLTERQLAAKEKAQSTRNTRYTCVKCGTCNTRTVNKTTKLCKRCSSWCHSRIHELTSSIEALQTRLTWTDTEHIDSFVILDTETTGLYASDEIVEISIIDLKKNTLYSSLINPLKTIPDDAISIHGITNEMVVAAPTLAEAYQTFNEVLMDKIILAYNASFDSSMLESGLKRQGISAKYQFECVMLNEMQIQQTDYFISLAHACSMEKCQQGHRALSDCHLVYYLITDRNWILREITEYREEVSQLEQFLSMKPSEGGKE